MNNDWLRRSISLLQPQSLALRSALSTAVGIFLAVFVDRHYSLLQACWVPLVALLVMQRTVRPALQNFLVISVSVVIGSIIFSAIHPKIIATLGMVTVFMVACYGHARSTVSSSGMTAPLLVGVVMLMLLVPSASEQLVYARMHDVVLGGALGILSGLFIFPSRADVDFRQGVIPVLNASREYLLAIMGLLVNPENSQNVVQEKKHALEKVLQTQQALFPEWIYAPGFNLALQQGHRHFLLKVERIAQILFAMHYAARQTFDPELLAAVQQPLKQCMFEAEKWLAAIVTVLDLGKLQSPVSDLEEDILALEDAFKQQGSVPLELADEVPDYLYFSAILFNLKDLQKVLLKLSEALR
jgi:uncharacterized membrane protein YccC